MPQRDDTIDRFDGGVGLLPQRGAEFHQRVV